MNEKFRKQASHLNPISVYPPQLLTLNFTQSLKFLVNFPLLVNCSLLFDLRDLSRFGYSTNCLLCQKGCKSVLYSPHDVPICFTMPSFTCRCVPSLNLLQVVAVSSSSATTTTARVTTVFLHTHWNSLLLFRFHILFLLFWTAITVSISSAGKPPLSICFYLSTS